MSNNIGTVINIVFATAGLFVMLLIVVRAVIAAHAKEKTLIATVVNKQHFDKQIYNKAQAPYTQKEYLVTFLCGKKKRTFRVSEFSYHEYVIGQTGYLTYKGNRLIDFH